MDKFVTALEIPSYMSDIRYRLRAVSFMELAQDIAGKGADDMNFGDRDLAPLNAVWVLARMCISFVDTPHRYDNVTLETWHRGLKGAQYIRDYQMKDSSGKVLVASTSSWLIMEKSERRLLHGDVLEPYVSSSAQCDEAAVERPCGKIVVPSGTLMSPAGSRVVSYSDVDYNLHTNNTKYIQWALDALPDELTFDGELSELQINFNLESHRGQTVCLMKGERDGVWYVEGLSEDSQRIFISTFRFK